MGLNTIKEKKQDGQDVLRRELKKHAAAIHCSNSLSLLQRKITNALLYHAYPELMVKEEHEITVKQLCKLIGYQGNNHSAIKDALRELLSTVIEWNLINDKTGGEDWTASSILASVSLQGPLCYFAYSPRMKQLLHSPSMFGRIDLFIQSQFRSSYGLALYENCIRYRGLPYTKWMELDTFRKLMGVPSDKYSIFRDFKKRVLDKAVEEVNSYSDLHINAELQREGRQMVRIRFLLKERVKRTRIGNHQKNSYELSNDQISLKVKLIEHYDFSSEQAERLLKEYGEARVQQKIDLIESSSNFKQGRVQNRSAYLVSALKFDYQEPKSPKNNERGAVNNRDDHLLKRTVEEIKADYQRFRNHTLDETLENLSENDKQAFMQRFQEYAHVAISTVLHLQRKKYTSETVLSSPQIRAILRQFIEQEFFSPETLSLDIYLEKLPFEKREAWLKTQK